MKIPCKIDPEEVTALVDTRESLPWDLAPLRVEEVTLDTGDYSLKGAEDLVRLERKTLPDLLNCVGQSRDRFQRELSRLKGYETRAVLVEASWEMILAGEWRNQLTPAQVAGSVLGWQANMGIPFMFLGTREAAQDAARRMLFLVARRRYHELRTMVLAMTSTEGAETNYV